MLWKRYRSRLRCKIESVLFDSSHISRLSKMRSRHTMSAGNEAETRSLSTSPRSSDPLLSGDFNSYGIKEDRHQRGPEENILRVRHSFNSQCKRVVKLREPVYLTITIPLHPALLRQDSNMCTRAANCTEIVDFILYVAL